MIGYEAGELAALAREAWAFLAVRKPGAPKIRFEQPADDKASGGEHLKSISVIEIVNDDMPFLVDSVMAELTERGLAARLVVHPILAVERDKAGKLTAPPKEAGNDKDETRESFIHIHVARVDDAAAAPRSCRRWSRCWPRSALRARTGSRCSRRIGEVIEELKANPPPVPVDDIAEAIQFLEWVAADNFTLFGVRDYALRRQGARSQAGQGFRARHAARTAKSRCSPAAARR